MPPQANSENRDCDCEDLVALDKRVQVLEHGFARQKEAFVKNDLGIPDYDGHRVAHHNSIQQAKVLEGYKRDMTKRVLEWLLVAAGVIIGQGLLEWLKDHLK